MITVNHVVKTFDGFRALDDLSISVPDGAVYGLVGPNGAGKTTILRHLTGVMRPDAGQVLVDGAPVFENTAVKRRITAIPDEIYYFPQASIREMMRFYRGVYPRFDEALYKTLGEAFGLDERLAMRKLSKGQRKQAAFWLAMCTRPDYLLLDEPIDGLDPVMRRQVWSLLLDDAAARGVTVLVSSHNLRELEDVCDHVGIMDRGKMLLERALSELQDNIVKVQLVTENALPPDLTVLHRAASGRVQTLIVRGQQHAVSDRIGATLPIFYDILPLSLEEIFIYELGGVDYAVKSIVL
ncbi:MAG: ABC transporter ATP-binding protein [Oscillospiraceae bacterium]|nr:ABC transporter ATP-binding protein [Oscillospiraceae bacterium]